MATVSVCSVLDRLFSDAAVQPAAPVQPAAVQPARGMVAISGNTYPVKDQLKALGARWNAAQKVWMISADKLDQARQIVAGAPKKEWTKTDSIAAAARKRGETPGVCGECGARCKFPYTLCWDCKEERDMGY
jgi:hypothetical protein